MVAATWQETFPDLLRTSVSYGLPGFLLALALGTLLGLTMTRVPSVRAVAGPVLSGLRSLPSVVWVPAVILWQGLNAPVLYAVLLLGAAPPIAQGLASAPPGYLAGVKQGWAFAWRALLAAVLIASALPHATTAGTAVVLTALLLVTVGIAVDLLILTPLERRVRHAHEPLTKN
ncbi:hypothetical protein ACFV9W_22860 [Streptomyces sp. NPDC059897]|uniref:hypothetical protein n=1 Tax=Streptomyces sp. NPDC059897 TaxID=3346994 RepID=UPI00366237F8